MKGNMRAGDRQLAILISGLTAGVTVVTGQGGFDLWDAGVGLLLLLLLRPHAHVYDESSEEKLAFAAVWALCLFLLVAFLIEFLLLQVGWQRPAPPSPLNRVDAIEVGVWLLLGVWKRSRL